jgi:dTDP-4-amino-4,6-dideoxygalactose transaminase
MEKIPVLDLRPGIQSLWPHINEAIKKVVDGTDFINGTAVERFERNIATYLGVQHAIGVNSGTDALTIALRALDIKEGDEVITTPFTFYATVESIQTVGATPVLVDIEPDTYNIDPKKVIEKLTAKTKAIIPVHLYGHGAALDEILKIARANGLKILEDNAQSFSGEWNGQKLGAIGDIGALSFFPSKNLGAFGDAGMVVTNDEELAVRARMLRAHGARRKYFNEMIGYNSRLDTIQAAILDVKLGAIEKSTLGRRQAAARYKELLSASELIGLPVERPGYRHCYHQYTIRIKGGRRDQVKSELKEAGVETMIYYPTPIHKLPVFNSGTVAYPEAELAAEEVLSLPIWPEIGANVQEYVSSKLRLAL